MLKWYNYSILLDSTGKNVIFLSLICSVTSCIIISLSVSFVDLLHISAVVLNSDR
jgi:hypothetical protein